MRIRLVSVLAAAAVSTLVLGACSSTPEGSESKDQSEQFASFYSQTVNWGQCDDRFDLSEDTAERLSVLKAPIESFECAMIQAPIDWNDAENTKTIDLAVVHVPATGNDKIGTLFGNPGGPGGSGLSYTYGMVASEDFAPVLERYDIIGFDPRGIGRSTPVECEEQSNVREIQLALCAAEQPLAHSMGTSQVARDMDLMRALQGEEKLDYLGYSYGTILGATYSTLFPERVGRMVLDSAPDETWAAPTGNYTQTLSMLAEVTSMLERCQTEYAVTSCPITTEDELAAKVEALNEHPLLTTDGNEISGNTLYAYLQAGLYGLDVQRPIVLETMGGALAGDQASIDAIGEALAGGGASVSFAGQIVSCHSLPQDPDILGLLETMEERGVPKLLGGPELPEELVAEFADISCGALPEASDDLEAFTAPRDTTMLMIGITGDHATPYENGRALAEQMGNTRFVTLEGHGHGASFTQRSKCVDDVVTSFLLEGDLPKDGLVCEVD